MQFFFAALADDQTQCIYPLLLIQNPLIRNLGSDFFPHPTKIFFRVTNIFLWEFFSRWDVQFLQILLIERLKWIRPGSVSGERRCVAWGRRWRTGSQTGGAGRPPVPCSARDPQHNNCGIQNLFRIVIFVNLKNHNPKIGKIKILTAHWNTV